MGLVYLISGWGCGIEETEKQKSRITRQDAWGEDDGNDERKDASGYGGLVIWEAGKDEAEDKQERYRRITEKMKGKTKEDLC